MLIPRLSYVLLLVMGLAHSPANCQQTTKAEGLPGSSKTDRFGDPLPEGALTRFGTLRFRHGGQATAIAYSPDGKLIATGGSGRILLWEAATGKLVARLQRKGKESNGTQVDQSEGHIFGLAFTPDNKRLISVGSPTYTSISGNCVFWDLASRQMESEEEHLEPDGFGWIRAVAISPDGTKTAIGADDGELRILDTKTHALIAEAKLIGISSLCFSPDGKKLAVGSYQATVVVDASNCRVVQRIKDPDCPKVVFAPDGKSIWLGCGGGKPFLNALKLDPQLKQWDLGSEKIIQTFDAGKGHMQALAISPDGKNIVAGGENFGPLLCETSTGKTFDLRKSRKQIDSEIRDLAFAPDGKSFVAATSIGDIRAWSLATRQELHTQDGRSERITAIASTSDGKQVATGRMDGSIAICDISTGKVVYEWFANEAQGFASLAFTPDNRFLLTSGFLGLVRLWDITTGKEVHCFRKEKGFALAALSPDGKLVAVSGKNGKSIHLHDRNSGRLLREIRVHSSHDLVMSFSPDGRNLLSIAAPDFSDGKPNEGFIMPVWNHDDLIANVWNIETGDQLQSLNFDQVIGRMSMSTDGRVLARGGSGSNEYLGSLRFWDLASGKELVDRRIKVCSAHAISPDGRFLAVADTDIRLIELASGKEIRRFTFGDGDVDNIAFTPDGSKLLSSHNTRTALVWDLSYPKVAVGAAEKLWADLASEDPQVFQRAVAVLNANPKIAMELLGEKLKPAPQTAGSRTTEALLADLESPMYRTRELATKELAKRMGSEYPELLVHMTKTKSSEVKDRLKSAFQMAPSPWPKLSNEELRIVRSVGVLDKVATKESNILLKSLATGDPTARITQEARASLRRTDSP